jgi:hypothetical protein
MSDGFNEAWAASVVGALGKRGAQFADGYTDDDLASISTAFGCPAPPELAEFLRAGVPVSPKWARWIDGPAVVAEDARQWLERAFAFDIEHGEYWHPSFGEQPRRVEDAIAQALRVVAEAPPLMPIYAHRFLVTAPADGPRPVLSVWQAFDSIFYGNDLADYFANEFDIPRPLWATSEPPGVPVWEDLFDLFCRWMETG